MSTCVLSHFPKLPPLKGQLTACTLNIVDFSAVEYYAVSIYMDPVFLPISKFTNENNFLNSVKPTACLCPLLPNFGSFMSIVVV
jgi:hypothetical protein